MEPRKGYRSSEFWLSVAAMVVGAVLASGAFDESSTVLKLLGAASSILAALGYTAARMVVKGNEAKAAALVAAADATPRP